jgi:tRNA(Ile)-lysidine synthase
MLARSAQHFAEASQLLDELAQLDAVQAFDGETLDVNVLRSLSHVRAKNLLRYCLHMRGAVMPQSVQIEDMLRQLCEARADAALCVAFGDWEVRRYQDRVYVMQALSDFDRAAVLIWSGEDGLTWPAMGGNILFSRGAGVGINLEKLKGEQISLRLRSGGETLRLHSKGSNRSLKNILQEKRVPPWQRERLPLLYHGGKLVAVVGVAIHTDYQVKAGEASLLVSWE